MLVLFSLLAGHYKTICTAKYVSLSFSLFSRRDYTASDSAIQSMRAGGTKLRLGLLTQTGLWSFYILHSV
jgi:hypothetical protein